MIVFKCLLVTLLCIDGIIIPVVAEMGELATIISIFAGLGLSVLVLKILLKFLILKIYKLFLKSIKDLNNHLIQNNILK